MTRAGLKTARLSLRPVLPSDEAAVVAALNDLAVSGWLQPVPYPYAVADFLAFQQDYAVPGATYAICDAHGFAGVMGIEDRTLGYWLTPACQGKGFATEAARMLLAEHFADSPEPIASGYFDGNARSAGVLRKLGFVETGQGMKYCRALGHDRPHIDMRLTRDAFVAALTVEARSARLAYRSLYPTDLEDLHSLVSHWDVVRQLASYPWPPDLAFTRSRAQPFAGRGFVWGAFLSGRLIGTVAVTADELGYMFAPDVWRQGYGTEACQTALSAAFAETGQNRRDHLQAGVWADNLASLALLHRLGFQVTADDLSWNKARGAKVPGHVLRLTRAEWRTQKA